MEEKEFVIRTSYLEIYNEKINDLLQSKDQQVPLMLIEDQVKGIVVPDLLEYEIKDLA